MTQALEQSLAVTEGGELDSTERCGRLDETTSADNADDGDVARW